MRELLLLFWGLLSFIPAGAQATWVTGAVEDSITHNPLPGVTVSVMNDTTARVVTNTYGLFRITVPPGGTYLVFSHPRYHTRTIAIERYSRMLVEIAPLEKDGDGIAMAKAKAKSRLAHSSNPNYGNTVMGIRTFFDETYGVIYENKFVETMKSASSAFAIDVDRAAYSNIRRFVRLKEPVPPDAVRIEEMVNYFQYDEPPPPDSGQLLAIHGSYAGCPWEPAHHLLKIAIRARQVDIDSLPASNLVFLIDVSGSMGSPNKLPLLQAAFRVLVNNLRAKDRVAIVAYAGVPGVVLPGTPGDQREKILNAIDYLSAGGATAGEAAIKMAYQIAVENFIPNGNNRVILATDGDFNVGQTSDQEMEELIMEKKESGVLLTCLGFGMRDYKDSKLETLSSKGNGNFAYIDNLEEANKIFAREFGSTLFTVAKDASAQVWFNPSIVKAYRLIGYENKVLKEDSSNGEKIVGGIVGAGHSTVALYEVVPRTEAAIEDSLLARVKLFYRLPADTVVYSLQKDIPGNVTTFKAASGDFRFASAVALLGMLLRKSTYKGKGNANMVQDIAKDALGHDREGYRKEFLKLVKELKKTGSVR